MESIVGAVISWLVSKILDWLSDPTPRETLPSFRWFFALGFGGAAGGFLSGALGAAGVETPGGLGNWTVFGAAIGISQWWVLRGYLGVGPSWAALSALGWSVWSYFQATQAPAPAGWLVVGLAVGVLQWFSLMQRVRRHILWIPANVLAWPIAGGLGTAFGFFLAGSGVDGPVAWVLGWACVGAVASLVLGFVLRRMPRKPRAAAR